MAKQIPSIFTQYELTEEEVKIAQTFNPLQLMYLNDLRAKVAETKLRITYDPHDPLKFASEQAYMDAKIDLLNEIIGEQR